MTIRREFAAFSIAFMVAAGAAGDSAGSVEPLVIVKDRKAAAAVVVPGNPTPVIRYAAEELQYHIHKATGAEVQITSEGDRPAQSPAIYLGPTRRARQAGINPDELERNGFVIRRVGPDLLMVGHDSDGEVLGNYNSTRVGTLFAVYEFLEVHLGVRWLWPGPLGECIPSRADIVVEDWDQTEGYRFEWAQLRTGANPGSDAWSSREAGERFERAQNVWLKRQRMSQLSNIRPTHGFKDYWRRFGETRPEYFSRLPNGERRPWTGDPGVYITMCVSQPALWDQIIKDWVDSGRSKYNGIINLGENDGAGACTCDACRAWDAPDPRFEQSDYWTGNVSGDQLTRANRFELPKGPSLSDRYAKFYLAVQKRAEKIHPDARVAGFVYQNYAEPPRKTKLNDRVILSLVPHFMWPWSHENRQAFLDQWRGWYETGARLILRPNYTHVGHNMPLFYARELGEDVGYALTHGAIGTDFDTLRGSWGTQGPTLYMLGRVHVRPDLSADEILDEYYSAFGPAEPQVRAYFDHWEAVSHAITRERFEEILKRTGAHTFREWYVLAPHFFTEDVMAKGRALLKAAADAAGGDRTAEQRVAYLEKGLRHAELTLAVQKAYDAREQSPDGQNLEACRAALGALDGYRREIEDDYVNDMSALLSYENRKWDRSILAQEPAGVPLPDQGAGSSR